MVTWWLHVRVVTKGVTTCGYVVVTYLCADWHVEDDHVEPQVVTYCGYM